MSNCFSVVSFNAVPRNSIAHDVSSKPRPAAGRRKHLSGQRSSMGREAGGLSGQSFQVGAHFGPFLSGWFPASAPEGGRFCPDSASGLPYYCQGSCRIVPGLFPTPEAHRTSKGPPPAKHKF